MEWGWDNGRALIGIVLIYGICLLVSERRGSFPWKIVVGATLMQFAFALILFWVTPIRSILLQANVVVDGLQEATRAGTNFVFGYVGDNVAASQVMDGSPPPLFFFQILPIVIVVAALSAILWHWRILRWITNGFAYVFQRLMGLGGATSLAVSANVFMGMTEAPVLIRPYIKGMTRSELLIMMTAGFATKSGVESLLDKDHNVSGLRFDCIAWHLSGGHSKGPGVRVKVSVPQGSERVGRSRCVRAGYDAKATGLPGHRLKVKGDFGMCH